MESILRISELLRLPFTNTNLESILRSARRAAGQQDYGSERILEPLNQLLSGIVGDPSLGPFARFYWRSLVRRALINRLNIEAYFRRHGDCGALNLQRPIFVVGFPRTGTTLLHNLLSQEPGRRAFQFWELTRPAPHRQGGEKDRRRRYDLCERDLYWAYKAAPEMVELHEIRSDRVEECWPLMVNNFSVLNFDLAGGRRAFGDWLLEADLGWAYREYRRNLQVLLHQDGEGRAGQIVMKCPEHLWFLDSLLEVFPDACVVWTHREPTSCIASYCSMVSINLRTVYGSYDNHEVGAHITKRFHQGVSRAMAVRDRVGDSSFLDVNFLDLVGDPLAAVARIESHFGLEQTGPGREAMDTWMKAKRGDHRGAHRYSAARYGLEREPILELFAPYMQRFGIEAPPP